MYTAYAMWWIWVHSTHSELKCKQKTVETCVKLLAVIYMSCITFCLLVVKPRRKEQATIFIIFYGSVRAMYDTYCKTFGGLTI
jgi:hypothetical protein